MRTRTSFVVMGIAVLASAAGCDSTRPFISEVDLARQAWVRARPAAYRFDVESRFSMLPPSGFIQVEVENGVVVEARDFAGNPVENFTLTVDSLWARLLAARDRGELNAARFDRNGVPTDFDYGPWEVDGGVGYRVRNFVRRS